MSGNKPFDEPDSEYEDDEGMDVEQNLGDRQLSEFDQWQREFDKRIGDYTERMSGLEIPPQRSSTVASAAAGSSSQQPLPPQPIEQQHQQQPQDVLAMQKELLRLSEWQKRMARFSEERRRAHLQSSSSAPPIATTSAAPPRPPSPPREVSNIKEFEDYYRTHGSFPTISDSRKRLNLILEHFNRFESSLGGQSSGSQHTRRRTPIRRHSEGVQIDIERKRRRLDSGFGTDVGSDTSGSEEMHRNLFYPQNNSFEDPKYRDPYTAVQRKFAKNRNRSWEGNPYLLQRKIHSLSQMRLNESARELSDQYMTNRRREMRGTRKRQRTRPYMPQVNPTLPGIIGPTMPIDEMDEYRPPKPPPPPPPPLPYESDSDDYTDDDSEYDYEYESESDE